MKLKKFLTTVITGVMMLTSTAPVLAADTENTFEAELSPSWHTTVVFENQYIPRDLYAYVNTDPGNNNSMTNVRSYVEFNIPDIENVKSITLKTYGYLRTDRHTAKFICVTNDFAERYSDKTYDSETEEYAYYTDYLKKDGTPYITLDSNTSLAEEVVYDTVDNNGNPYQIYTGYFKLDCEELFEGLTDSLKENGGRLAFRTAGGNNNVLNLHMSTLLVDYDKQPYLEGAANAIAQTDAASMKSGVEEFNLFIGVDTDALCGMSYVYSVLAKNNETEPYTDIELFKQDFETIINSLIADKEVALKDYVIIGSLSGAGEYEKILINQAAYTADDGSTKAIYQINKRFSALMTGFEIENKEAVKSISASYYISNLPNQTKTEPIYYGFAYPAAPVTGEYLKDSEDGVYDIFNNYALGLVAANKNIALQIPGKGDIIQTGYYTTNVSDDTVADLKSADGNTLILTTNVGETWNNLGFSVREGQLPKLTVSYDTTYFHAAALEAINALTTQSSVDDVLAIFDNNMVSINDDVKNKAVEMSMAAQNAVMEQFVSKDYTSMYDAVSEFETIVSGTVDNATIFTISSGNFYNVTDANNVDLDGDGEYETEVGWVNKLSVTKNKTYTGDYAIVYASYKDGRLDYVDIIDANSQGGAKNQYNELKALDKNASYELNINFFCTYKPDEVKAFILSGMNTLKAISNSYSFDVTNDFTN